MSKSENIGSLEELRARKAEIKAENESARHGLVSSLSKAPGKIKEFAFEDLALPAMGIGLAVYVGYRFLRSNKSKPVTLPPSAPMRVPASSVAPKQTPPPRPATQQYTPPPAGNNDTAEAVSAGFNFASLITAGNILFPAAKAIIGVVQNHRAKQQTAEQLHDAKQGIVAEVE